MAAKDPDNTENPDRSARPSRAKGTREVDELEADPDAEAASMRGMAIATAEASRV